MLTEHELQKLITTVAGLYDFTDGGPRARRVLIQQSGLGRFLTTIDLSGSSGSPVFNRKWEMVALHHSGSPYPPPKNGEGTKGGKKRFRVNEGIPCRAILEAFKQKDLERYLPRN